MFDEYRSASRNVNQPYAWTSEMVRPPSTYRPCSAYTLSSNVARPCSRSAATRNGFSVDPGSYGSVTAVHGCAAASRRLTAARISPVRGSAITMSPPVAPVSSTACRRASSAISWRS